MVKNPPANAGDVRDTGSIPGSGRSPEGGHDNLLQYFCPENLRDRGAWQAIGRAWRLQGPGVQTLALLPHMSSESYHLDTGWGMVEGNEPQRDKSAPFLLALPPAFRLQSSSFPASTSKPQFTKASVTQIPKEGALDSLTSADPTRCSANLV